MAGICRSGIWTKHSMLNSHIYGLLTAPGQLMCLSPALFLPATVKAMLVALGDMANELCFHL